MVDQVFVAERKPEDALAQQIGHGMADRIGNAQIGDALRQLCKRASDPTCQGRSGGGVVPSHAQTA